MAIDDNKKKELLQPYQEKVDLVDSFMEEIREKLGDDATKINDSLLGLRGTVVEATELHETAVVTQFETSEKNQKLMEVNNDLYIKSSAAIKGARVENKIEEMDDDEALDAFADDVLGVNKK